MTSSLWATAVSTTCAFLPRAASRAANARSAGLSKIENDKLDFGDYPGEGLIRRLAQALKADEDELLLLAEKVPEAFRKLARLDDESWTGCFGL